MGSVIPHGLRYVAREKENKEISRCVAYVPDWRETLVLEKRLEIVIKIKYEDEHFDFADTKVKYLRFVRAKYASYAINPRTKKQSFPFLP